MPFKSCFKCSGEGSSIRLVECFPDSSYGHVECRRCGITHDDNVDAMNDIVIDSKMIESIESDELYRKMFVETSQVQSDSGEEYVDFSWDSQIDMKQLVVEPVLVALGRKFKIDESFMLLDLGAASGFTSKIYTDEFPSAQVIAVDPSPQVMSVDGYQNRLKSMQGTIQTVEVPAQSVDAIVIIGNLMLHTDPMDTINLAIEKLKPNGILVFDFKNVKASSRDIARLLAKVGLKKLIPSAVFARNFINMRFGFNESYVNEFMKRQPVSKIGNHSKPPRLLGAKNASSFSSGVSGAVWRFLDQIDRVRGQQAWIQMEFVKNVQ